MNFRQWLQEGTKFTDIMEGRPEQNDLVYIDGVPCYNFTSKKNYEGQEVEAEIELVGEDWLPLAVSPSSKVKTTFVCLKGVWYNKDVISFHAKRRCSIRGVVVSGFPGQKEKKEVPLTSGRIPLWKGDTFYFEIAGLSICK